MWRCQVTTTAILKGNKKLPKRTSAVVLLPHPRSLKPFKFDHPKEGEMVLVPVRTEEGKKVFLRTWPGGVVGDNPRYLQWDGDYGTWIVKLEEEF